MAPTMFPMQPVRDRYVTPFGGVSAELAAGEVGVNAAALKRNTRLVPGEDDVLVSSDLDNRARPLFARPLFRVIALEDDERPDASSQSPRGEVVFSSEDFGGSRDNLFESLRQGAYVVLNATLARHTLNLGVRVGGIDVLFARRRFDGTAE